MRMGEGRKVGGGEAGVGEKERTGRKRPRRKGLRSEWDQRRLNVRERRDAQKKGKRFSTEDG